jgi:Trk K+ transport system NAD-binding subunit
LTNGKSTSDPEAPSVVLLGEGALPSAAALALERAGARVTAMRRPSDRDIARLAEVFVDTVVIVARDDIRALRLALLVEHARPGVTLIVTLFDRTVAAQVRAAVPRCRVVSLADIVAPTLAGPCIDDSCASLIPTEGGYLAARATGDAVTLANRVDRPGARATARVLRLAPRPFDVSSRFLVGGLAGFAAILATDFVIGTTQLEERPVDAWYAAVKALVTVGPNPAVDHAAGWVRLLAAALMLATVAMAAILTAGIVNRLLDARFVGIVGLRAVPRRDHVIVVGLGQVGIRLCLLLRELGIPVVAVERDRDAPWLQHAKSHRIPVVLGSGGDRLLLERLGIRRARALAAVTSDDLENVAVAVAASALVENMRVVLRAGDGDVATETRALFHIGVVRDLHRIGADLLAAAATGHDAVGAVPHDGETWIAVRGTSGPELVGPS